MEGVESVIFEPSFQACWPDYAKPIPKRDIFRRLSILFSCFRRTSAVLISLFLKILFAAGYV